MDSFNGFEYTVEQKREGKLKKQALLLILLYFVFTGSVFGVIFAIGIVPLGAVVPVLLYILYLCTWRYVQVSYTYKIETGVLKLVKGYGAKLKKPVCEFKIKECKLIAPLAVSEEKFKEHAIDITYDARPSTACNDAYLIIAKDADGKNIALKLQVTAEALKTFKYYNSSTVMSETRV